MLDELIKVRFLGVGGASQTQLGHASCVIELGDYRLLVDCGPGTVNLFKQTYGSMPDAVFVTHCHLDHVGDFENLFIQSWFHQPERKQPQVFVPTSIVSLLNTRVGSYPEVLAEGGVNFWEAFQLIPVFDKFIFHGFEFEVVEVRHHTPRTAFGLLMREVFFYTGDSRPIPEVMQYTLGDKEVIFHDCGVVGNPSHTGIDDLLGAYPPDIIERIYCYHYYTLQDVKCFQEKQLKVISQGDVFEFSLPVLGRGGDVKYYTVGHRGWPQKYPENSKTGLLAAAKAGAQYLELDVQMSRDGIPVVFHDDTLGRVSEGEGYVWDFSANELSGISCHEPRRFGDQFYPEPIAELEDVCRELAVYDPTVFVEIKEESFAKFDRQAVLDAVAKAIIPIARKAVIISFDYEILAAAKKIYPIGWVLRDMNAISLNDAKNLAPQFLIYNVKKMKKGENIWPGEWEWFFYDIVDRELAKVWFNKGVKYIETWDIEALLRND